jgi:hypothetical protein
MDDCGGVNKFKLCASRGREFLPKRFQEGDFARPNKPALPSAFAHVLPLSEYIHIYMYTFLGLNLGDFWFVALGENRVDGFGK